MGPKPWTPERCAKVKEVLERVGSRALDWASQASLPSRSTSRVRSTVAPLLVPGGAGAVGGCAVQLARRAGALVVATILSSADESIARNAAHTMFFMSDRTGIDRASARLRRAGSIKASRTRSRTGPALRIIDVGLAVSYRTPSAFAASFRGVVGVTRPEFRRKL